jgi:hypothetical protein
MDMPSSPTHNYFQNQPGQWGLRGDPHLWSELEARFASLPPPATADALDQLLHQFYREATGEPPKKGATPFVARYKTGGMSSGMVSADFWLERGFPQIIQNFLDQPRAQVHATGLTNEARVTISNCALRFDGYAYVKAHLPHLGNWSSEFHALLEKAQSTGKFSVNHLENFAANYYLHRGFHGQGSLPELFSPGWYDMALYFLHLYRLPTPAVHRHASADDWDRRPRGAAERAAAEFRQLLRRHR